MAKKQAPKYPNRKKLTDWIQSYYIRCGWDKNDINWNMITAQIKNIEDKDKSITDMGILYTLWFMSAVKEIYLLNNSENGSILNLVPFYYSQAQEYYNNERHLKQLYAEHEFKHESVIVIRDKEYVAPRKKLNIDFD